MVEAAHRERATVGAEGDGPSAVVGWPFDVWRRRARGDIPDLCAASLRWYVATNATSVPSALKEIARPPRSPMLPSVAPVAASQSSTPPPRRPYPASPVRAELMPSGRKPALADPSCAAIATRRPRP